MNYLPWIAWIILIVGVVVGALGTVIPAVPGAALVFVSVLIHKVLLPETFSWATLVVLGVLTGLSWAVDFFGGAVIGSKLGNATPQGLIGATVGGLFGIPFGLPGLILGPFIGAVAGDLYANRRKISELVRSGVGATFGFFASLILRVVLLATMVTVIVFAIIVK